MKFIQFAIAFACVHLALSTEPETTIYRYNIIVVLPEGVGHRYILPFLADKNSGGLHFWENIAEPFYVKSEDTSTLRDVNLFSLTNIAIHASRPATNPASLTIDFREMRIPEWFRITKKEVIFSAFYCILKGSYNDTLKKPSVSYLANDEDVELIESERGKFDENDFHKGGDEAKSSEFIDQTNP